MLKSKHENQTEIKERFLLKAEKKIANIFINKVLLVVREIYSYMQEYLGSQPYFAPM